MNLIVTCSASHCRAKIWFVQFMFQSKLVIRSWCSKWRMWDHTSKQLTHIMKFTKNCARVLRWNHRGSCFLRVYEKLTDYPKRLCQPTVSEHKSDDFKISICKNACINSFKSLKLEKDQGPASWNKSRSEGKVFVCSF